MSEDHGHHGIDATDLVRFALVAVAVLASWVHPLRVAHGIDLISLVATVLGGIPIWAEALEALGERRMTMELSMTIAVGAALAINETFTAVVLVWIVLIAETIEHQTVDRGRTAIKRLTDLLPRIATVRRDGGEREIDITAIRPGETVIVKPGARLPVDGDVVGGHSFVDQAAITGESLPVEKTAGAGVFAGTINQSGTLEIRTASVGADTAFGKIIDVVERAESSRAPIQKVADRMAGYLVYFSLACAAFTFAITRDPRSTIAVIIAAGACGIAAGTPLAILGAIGRTARAGAIVKGGIHLESLGRVDTIVLDKTGTLTLGVPKVVAVRAIGAAHEREVLAVAALAEKRSEHPLARAILDAVAATPDDPDEFAYTPGLGITCAHRGARLAVGNRGLMERERVALDTCPAAPSELTEILVARDHVLLGAIHVADVLRPEAAGAVAQLRAMGLRTVLLTGDSPAIANAVGKQLGVDELDAGLLPDQKLARVTALMADGKRVAMVGDGVNDAPALAQATVGIAMGSGTDVARESANVLLIGNDLSKLVEAIGIARRCRQIIAQNFAGTLIVDACAVALAALGVLTPLLAAIVHVTSELAFILNSTRLLP
jgi:heavy metal translocating P-type ATPase